MGRIRKEIKATTTKKKKIKNQIYIFEYQK